VFFDGFELDEVELGEVTLRVRHGGRGPAVLLLHGHPRTHATWAAVAPRLSPEFTVVCPDLRGYGRSSKPPSTPDHSSYSKRAMARDCVRLMQRLGHERFSVVGHDRGAYVAQRLALDHAHHVERLVVMDAVPIADALDRCDARFAASWWHWFFLGQTVKPAEDWICRDPHAWYRIDSAQMPAEAYADLWEALEDPAVVHAMCEDYRAGLGVDRAADEADRAAGKRIEAPTLVVWASRDDLEDLYGDPVAIWRGWADTVRGARLESGHHMAEEVPEELAATLSQFLR
jgi:haloacetate dehalogenase